MYMYVVFGKSFLPVECIRTIPLLGHLRPAILALYATDGLLSDRRLSDVFEECPQSVFQIVRHLLPLPHDRICRWWRHGVPVGKIFVGLAQCLWGLDSGCRDSIRTI